MPVDFSPEPALSRLSASGGSSSKTPKCPASASSAAGTQFARPTGSAACEKTHTSRSTASTTSSALPLTPRSATSPNRTPGPTSAPASRGNRGSPAPVGTVTPSTREQPPIDESFTLASAKRVRHDKHTLHLCMRHNLAERLLVRFVCVSGRLPFTRRVEAHLGTGHCVGHQRLGTYNGLASRTRGLHQSCFLTFDRIGMKADQLQRQAT
jgi:hypothetical protein